MRMTRKEWLIGVAAIAALATWIGFLINNPHPSSSLGTSTVTYGVNGLTEVRCIDGYKVAIGSRGMVAQMVDLNGRGIQCEESAQ